MNTEIMDEHDIAQFAFGTKGGTLARLSGLLSQACVCDQAVIRAEDWVAERDNVLSRLVDRFADEPLAVRSSASTEDTETSSNAGAYHSLLNVQPTKADIAQAIDAVLASYGTGTAGDEVLIQPMVRNVALSGVVMTRDLDTGAPYYVINYDDISGRTDTVTSGAVSKVIMVHRRKTDALHSARMRKIVSAVQEIERVVGSDALDIEFCLTTRMDVYILQVRPLAAHRNWVPVSDEAIDRKLADVHARLTDVLAPRDGVLGATSALGEMPDWNPAEMIGITPRPLALSLYKQLITDRTWAVARRDMGYRFVDAPLLTDFNGHPYIDVRLSLNSFLPPNIDEAFGHRLVEHQIQRLSEDRDAHDKIEFRIAVTCKDFNFAERANELREAGFAVAEIATLEAGLRDITGTALREGAAGIQAQLDVCRRLSTEAATAGTDYPLRAAANLLADTVPFGTLPFSILARHGFIAVTFLKSLVARDVISADDQDRFMKSIHSVATDLVEDIDAVTAGQLGLDVFLSRHGHLRPGTYDILSRRYDEAPELYFVIGKQRPKATPLPREAGFAFSAAQQRDIRTCLLEAGYDIEAQQLVDYMRAAIAGREMAKFSFTKGVSDALKLLCHWGEQNGFSRDDLSWLNIDALMAAGNDRATLEAQIDAAKDGQRLARAIRLPHLIFEPGDIDVVYPARGQATFITNKSITAPGIYIEREANPEDLRGKIVLIRSADPGFDWIFANDIAGLITQYGGANSHMAIRCAEFGLPAAIGCAERTFVGLLGSSIIELNCADRKVTAH